MKKRIIIIDALNTYLRNYVMNPSLTDNGDPIGGTKGFLMSMQKYCREMNPSHVFIVWDGPGGSTKKKKLDRGYKEGRKPVRLNRNVRLLDENQEMVNKIWQQTRLMHYLNEMPVCQFLVDQVEADDIIAYLTQMSEFEEHQKIIISSDRDFLQCCNDKTVIYQPMKKVYVNTNSILEEHSVHPNNFAIARAMAGDKSDNLAGIPGVGIKTIAKRFPFLADEKSFQISEIYEHCFQNEGVAFYDKIRDHSKVLEKNYRMMQLYSPTISHQTIQKISYSIENYPKTANKTKILKMMIEDGINVVTWNDLFTFFNRIRLGRNNDS